MDVDVAEAAKTFQRALDRQTKELEEKARDFEHRVKLFEQSCPDEGKDSDILRLNVGGSTTVAVFRRTLTYFEDSMLAAKFSGRWDDSLEKDHEGNFFIDQDPDVFLQLISFLRRCATKKGDNVEVPAPALNTNLSWMLEYYELMPAVYPFRWDTKYGECTCVNLSSNSFQFTSAVDTGILFQAPAGLRIRSFAVLLESGEATSAQVGWAANLRSGYHVGRDSAYHGFGINLQQKDIHERGTSRYSNLDVHSHLADILLQFSYDVKAKCYVIKVEGEAPPGAEQTWTSSTTTGNRVLFPAFGFTGKVTISNVRYIL